MDNAKEKTLEELFDHVTLTLANMLPGTQFLGAERQCDWIFKYSGKCDIAKENNFPGKYAAYIGSATQMIHEEPIDGENVQSSVAKYPAAEVVLTFHKDFNMVSISLFVLDENDKEGKTKKVIWNTLGKEGEFPKMETIVAFSKQ